MTPVVLQAAVRAAGGVSGLWSLPAAAPHCRAAVPVSLVSVLRMPGRQGSLACSSSSLAAARLPATALAQPLCCSTAEESTFPAAAESHCRLVGAAAAGLAASIYCSQFHFRQLLPINIYGDTVSGQSQSCL